MADLGYNSPAFTPIPVNAAVKFGPQASDTLDPKAHRKLLGHLYAVLHRDADARAQRIAHMMAVEYDLLGIVEPEGSDCDRADKRNEGKSVSIPDHIYPFGFVTLQKFTSELMSVLMPTEMPYSVVTGPEAQGTANSLSKAFRHQSVMFDHRNNLAACVFDAVTLDLTGGFFRWTKQANAKVETSLLGTQMASPTETAGVCVEHIDPYNLSYDSSLPPSKIEQEGEFIAQFKAVTPFQLRRDRVAGRNFAKNDMFDAILGHSGLPDFTTPLFDHANGTGLWYYFEPKIAQGRHRAHQLYGSSTNKGQTGFAQLFSYGMANNWQTRENNAIHQVVMMTRIDPYEYGLVKGPAPAQPRPFQIWEIHITYPGIITYAQPAQGRADRLPGFVASMNFDRKFGRSFKFGEHAAHMGLLASTILNLHKRGMRKALEGGVTLYNPEVIPLEQLDEMSGGRLPIRMMRYDDDLRRHILQLNDIPDSAGSINDAAGLSGMLDNLFPTNSQPAMAGLDRATQYQAQAVLMTGLRSLVYYATTLDGQIFVPTRFHMQHLNLLNAQEMSYIDEAKKQAIQVSAADLQKSQFVLVQSELMIGVDRLRATTELRDMINVMFQSGGQLPPLAALYMKHYMQMSGLAIDPDEYEAALQKQLQRDAAIQAAEVQAAGAAAGPPGVTPPPAPTAQPQ
jgi:hypothetical protein